MHALMHAACAWAVPRDSSLVCFVQDQGDVTMKMAKCRLISVRLPCCVPSLAQARSLARKILEGVLSQATFLGTINVYAYIPHAQSTCEGEGCATALSSHHRSYLEILQ